MLCSSSSPTTTTIDQLRLHQVLIKELDRKYTELQAQQMTTQANNEVKVQQLTQSLHEAYNTIQVFFFFLHYIVKILELNLIMKQQTNI
jgi:hypothetical protein